MSNRLRIVLVEPKKGGNVGSVARVMMNFGFHELALVNPPPKDDEMKMFAMHAWDIVEKAGIYESLRDAIMECVVVIGTTGILPTSEKEHLRHPMYTIDQLPYILHDVDGKIGVVFGREDNGLTANELGMCDIVATIPTSSEYPSMNLSHAVAITLYEMAKYGAGVGRTVSTFKDRDLFFEKVHEMLLDIDYPSHKIEKTMLVLRRVMGRA